MQWTMKPFAYLKPRVFAFSITVLAGNMFNALDASGMRVTSTTGVQRSLQLMSKKMAASSGFATTVSIMDGSKRIIPEHELRLKERGLIPRLCEELGVHSMGSNLKDPIAFDYRVGGQVHNTKIRRGKGNMPWVHAGKNLVLWNFDCLAADPAPDEEVIFTEGEFDAIACIQAGFTRVVSLPNGAQSSDEGFRYLYRNGELLPELQKFGRFVIATDGDNKGIACRDALAIHLGDERCRWVSYPPGCKDANDVVKKLGEVELANIVHAARPMWTDEIATIDDIPDPPDLVRYRLGIPELDHAGMRITLPCFWPIIGPYGSGKSVMLRQLLVNFWRVHGWRSLLTSFEEMVKPRYQRDLRRHLIGRPNIPDNPWREQEISAADEEMRQAFVFLRRAKGKPMHPQRLLDRIEYAVKVYGIKVVAIDPVNEIRMHVGRAAKTDYLGDLIMELKDLSLDYGLVVMCCAHVSKESKYRLAQRGMLTLNDGEDTRHWGGKADIGWCMWRNTDGLTYLNIDKIKDHETMGRPMLASLRMDGWMFCVNEIGVRVGSQVK